MEEWKLYKIGDVCKTISDTYKDNAENVVLINTSDILEGKCLNHKQSPNKDLKGQFKKTFKKEDILYSEIRPANKRYAYIDFDPTDYIASTKLMVIRHNEKILPQYLFYILKSQAVVDELQMLAESRSGTFPQITFSEVANMEIYLPPIAQQYRILSVLKSLDDKIEVNRRINENLEQQAQALFKSWFVDFEPFKGGEFVESELGMIPKGWRVGTLGEIVVEIESGSRPKGGAETDGIPSIGAEKIERFGFYDFSNEKYISSEYFAKMKRGHVEDGDVLLYKDGAYTGKSSMALDGFPYKECAVNEHVFLLRTLSSQYQYFLYCLISYPNIRTMIHTLASSKAAQPGLNQKELLGIDVILPEVSIIKQFNKLVAPLMHKIAANANESRRLASLRDTLLPRLMSGELKVNEIIQ